MHNLDEALTLRPEHLSLYLLEVHAATPLADQIKRGARPMPDEDLAAEMYQVMVRKVCAAGYQHYEISNFCLPGYESRHNAKYWTGVPYYGFGCSAHSFDGQGRRWANERDTARYVELVERGQSPVIEIDELSEHDKRAESVFLGLRMLSGISLKDYRDRFGIDLIQDRADEIDRLREAGLIERDRDLLRLTASGALMSNEVFARLS
jgi:oxygen-independent coproporphyrinogen-3 oxidase